MRKYEIGALPPQIAPALAGKLARVEIATIGHFRHRGFVHRGIASAIRSCSTCRSAAPSWSAYFAQPAAATACRSKSTAGCIRTRRAGTH